LSGRGRLPEIKQIIDTINAVLNRTNIDLKRKRILVTAGPTYEAIDPVRFIGNRSSGKMGFSIAAAAALRGADVTLIAGPTHLETPRNVKRIDVESAKEMLTAVNLKVKKLDAVIMAAAVADYTPVAPENHKIKKHSNNYELELKLQSTRDIIAALGKNKRKFVLVGFALETKNGLSSAKEKIQKKNLDFIILNIYNRQNRVFGSDFNRVKIIDRRGNVEDCSEILKFDIANKILDRVKVLL